MLSRLFQHASFLQCRLIATRSALISSLNMFAITTAYADPFSKGAAAAQSNILTILTPIAVVAVMAIGVAAWFNKVAWGWAVAGVAGIVLVFGAPQIVAWVRAMFGV